MRVVVYGAGYWGTNYVRELGGNLAAVVEPNPERAEYIRQTYNVPVYASDSDVPMDGVDGIVVCTPPDEHVPIALNHLKDGRYVLVEKPVAHSVEEAMQLYPYRHKCMVGHLYLYHPAVYHDMKTWMRTMPIDHAFARRTNNGPVRAWANAMWDLAAHEVSIFNYLLGRPITYLGTYTRDWAVLRLDYELDVNAIIYVSWLGGSKTRTIELVPPVGHSESFLFDDVQWSGHMEVSPLRRMLDEFLSGSWDRCTLDDGIDVVRVLEGII